MSVLKLVCVPKLLQTHVVMGQSSSDGLQGLETLATPLVRSVTCNVFFLREMLFFFDVTSVKLFKQVHRTKFEKSRNATCAAVLCARTYSPVLQPAYCKHRLHGLLYSYVCVVSDCTYSF